MSETKQCAYCPRLSWGTDVCVDCRNMSLGVKTEPKLDLVNQPAHYVEGRTIEPLAVIEDWKLPHHLACTLKYIARAGRKDDAKQDLDKALFYLKRYRDSL